MLAPPHRQKRPRSPTPPSTHDLELDLDIPSPLDALIKRRRRQGYPDVEDLPRWIHPDPVSNSHANLGENSTAPFTRQAIEKRRTKQWERLNAPQSQHPSLNAGYSHSHANPHQRSHSDPHRPTVTPPNIQINSQPVPSPSTIYPPSPPRYYSQPQPTTNRHHMSSSPIRHQPPDSSPFRDSPNGHETAFYESVGHGVGDGDMDDEMDPEERRREWGESYASQNELLYSLHRARRTQPPRTNNDNPITPHHHAQQSSLTPYRSYHIPSSSPFPSTATYAPSDSADEESMEMEQDHPHPDHTAGGLSHTNPNDEQGQPQQVNDEVKRRYEEANRLLAELDVVRRRRWGEG